MTTTADALDQATDLFGPLGPDCQRRIRALLAHPSEQAWDDAHSIILNGRTWRTLWQAVLLVDPAFPTSGPVVDAAGRRIELWTAVPSTVCSTAEHVGDEKRLSTVEPAGFGYQPRRRGGSS